MTTKNTTPYELIYWPGIPGRGEHIRLALEEAGATYKDTAYVEGGVEEVLSHVEGTAHDDGANPPAFAPPILRHGHLVMFQTSNILMYLGSRLGLAAHGDADAYRVNELVLTALDGLSNEVHDCHHPIATGLNYEDQIEESKRRAQDYVKNRLPKFLGYFERVTKSKTSRAGPWLFGGQITCADLVLFQVGCHPVVVVVVVSFLTCARLGMCVRVVHGRHQIHVPQGHGEAGEIRRLHRRLHPVRGRQEPTQNQEVSRQRQETEILEWNLQVLRRVGL